MYTERNQRNVLPLISSRVSFVQYTPIQMSRVSRYGPFQLSGNLIAEILPAHT
jgi:hypothetical protein